MEKTQLMGRNHVAPKEYVYCIRYIIISGSQFMNFLHLYLIEEKKLFWNVDTGNNKCLLLIPGCNQFNGIDVWIVNQEKQGYTYIWYKSQEDCKNLETFLDNKYTKPTPANSLALFKYSCQGWYHFSNYTTKYNIVGDYINNSISRIEQDLSWISRWVE